MNPSRAMMSWNIYVWFCWERSGPLDDNFIETIHESWLHMQDADKTKALSCMLTVKWPFSHVETGNIMAPLYHGIILSNNVKYVLPSAWLNDF